MDTLTATAVAKRCLEPGHFSVKQKIVNVHLSVNGALFAASPAALEQVAQRGRLLIVDTVNAELLQGYLHCARKVVTTLLVEALQALHLGDTVHEFCLLGSIAREVYIEASDLF